MHLGALFRRSVLFQAGWRVLVPLLVLPILTACPNGQKSGPPPQWAVTDTLVNANSPGLKKGQARQIVFFSNIQWQTTSRLQKNYAAGWRNDVLVGNQYSFQLIVSGGNLLDGGLILRDVATNTEIQATPARVNHSFDCGQSLNAVPGRVQWVLSRGWLELKVA